MAIEFQIEVSAGGITWLVCCSPVCRLSAPSERAGRLHIPGRSCNLMMATKLTSSDVAERPPQARRRQQQQQQQPGADDELFLLSTAVAPDTAAFA